MNEDLMRNNEFLRRLTYLIQLLGPPTDVYFCHETGALFVSWTCANGRTKHAYMKTEDSEELGLDTEFTALFGKLWFALRNLCETYDIVFHASRGLFEGEVRWTPTPEGTGRDTV